MTGHRYSAGPFVQEARQLWSPRRRPQHFNLCSHLGASGQLGLLDATEVRVRRPTAGRAGRQRLVPGKARANTVKALVITDADGRLRSDSGCGRPARKAEPVGGRGNRQGQWFMLVT